MLDVSETAPEPYHAPMHDALDRRLRFGHPEPGKPFKLNDVRYAVLKSLDRHKRLPTSYLSHFIGRVIKKDDDYARKKLTELYTGYIDKAGKHITFIKRHWFALDNTTQAIYGLTAHGQGIVDEGGAEPKIANSASPIHDLFVGCLSASFDLQGTEFISRGGIIFRDTCPAETKLLVNPFDIPTPRGAITPDDFFAIATDEGYISIALEADRATESGTVIKDKIAHYVQILENGVHRTRFKAPRLFIFIGTTTNVNADKIIYCLKASVPTKYQDRFRVKVFPEFGQPYRIPRAPLDVFGSWLSPTGYMAINKKATP